MFLLRHRPAPRLVRRVCVAVLLLAPIAIAPTTLVLLRAARAEPPRCLDDRLEIELFAENPSLVTPTGIAVDDQGRVLVIESNTHFRPEGYTRAKTDRILRFAGAGSDGRGREPTVFFEGTSSTMNLAVHPNGWTYVATRAEVFRIRDDDDDGRAERRETLVRHVTDGDYPHNGLSGFAFDFAGDVYFGQGENLGASYDLVGADGTTLSGGGEGGNIYRCDAQGNNLVRVATGFWNPFNVCLDAYGRLFAVDNDPDSRPPCRLVHVVADGDYGFRFRNGRRGLHPFTAWNGELPGTLPMVAGTGEAPSAVVSYESDALPDDFRGSLLTTSWGDHRIERFDLVHRGASFRSAAVPIIVGGDDFRPVGMAVAPDGTLYISDWVDKSYELHGKGRIWHIRSRDAKTPPRPQDAAEALGAGDRKLREAAAHKLAESPEGRDALRQALQTSQDERVRMTCWWALEADVANAGDKDGFDARALYNHEHSSDVRAAMLASSSADAVSLDTIARSEFNPLVQAAALRKLSAAGAANDAERHLLLGFLRDGDPFLRQAAREALGRVATVDELVALSDANEADTRLAAVLLLRRGDDADVRKIIPRLLDDADPRVRFCAVQWIGESQLKSYRNLLEHSMTHADMTPELFGAQLAALWMLDHGVVTNAKDEFSPAEYAAQILLADDTPDTIRARALRMLPATYADLTQERLAAWLASDEPSLALEALRTLRERDEPAARETLLDVAADIRYPHRLRAEAVVGLSPTRDDERELLMLLATGSDAGLRDEALRSLRGAQLNRQQRQALERLRDDGAEVSQLVDRVFHKAEVSPAAQEPVENLDAQLDEWLGRLKGPGDPEAGERVFFHPQGPGCFRCHTIDGRGNQVGPDLSTTARELSHERLVASIIAPSREVAPRFVTWTLVLKDGRVLQGMLAGESADGSSTYVGVDGERFTVQLEEVEQREQSSRSIMPDGLADLMTPGEFRDLLAYLEKRH